MERVRIQLFNQSVIDGRVYVAENKEFVEKIFAKYLVDKPTLFLTNKSQEIDLQPEDGEDGEHFFKRFTTVNLESIAGKFENIEIIETNELGFDGLPIIEVWADLKILDNDRGKFVDSLFKEEVATFGMRALTKCFPDNKKVITHLVSYDLVSKKA